MKRCLETENDGAEVMCNGRSQRLQVRGEMFRFIWLPGNGNRSQRRPYPVVLVSAHFIAHARTNSVKLHLGVRKKATGQKATKLVFQ